jgi:uncharacterized membrane protein
MNRRVAPRKEQQAAADRVAAGLSYVTGIPAVFYLTSDRYKRRPYLRFHAWQAIYFVLACVLITAVLGVVTDTVPELRFLQFDNFPLISLALVIVWVVILMKALNGEYYRLPLIGAMAEKRAKRIPE